MIQSHQNSIIDVDSIQCSRKNSKILRSRANSHHIDITKKARINAIRREIEEFYNKVVKLLYKVDQNFEVKLGIMLSKPDVDFRRVDILLEDNFKILWPELYRALNQKIIKNVSYNEKIRTYYMNTRKLENLMKNSKHDYKQTIDKQTGLAEMLSTKSATQNHFCMSANLNKTRTSKRLVKNNQHSMSQTNASTRAFDRIHSNKIDSLNLKNKEPVYINDYNNKPSTANNNIDRGHVTNAFAKTDYYRSFYEGSKYGVSGNRICYVAPNSAISGKLSADPYKHKMQNAFVGLTKNISELNSDKFVTENDEQNFQFSVKNLKGLKEYNNTVMKEKYLDIGMNTNRANLHTIIHHFEKSHKATLESQKTLMSKTTAGKWFSLGTKENNATIKNFEDKEEFLKKESLVSKVVSSREGADKNTQGRIKFDLNPYDFDEDTPFVQEFLEKQQSKQMSKRKQELGSNKAFMTKTDFNKTHGTSENIKWDEFYRQDSGVVLPQEDKLLVHKFGLQPKDNVFSQTKLSFKSNNSKQDLTAKSTIKKSVLGSETMVKKHGILEHISGYKNI